MADCFISYATPDRVLAEDLRRQLLDHGVTVFLAPVALVPGAKWTDEVRRELVSSNWVFFLASPTACQSPYVQHEVGGAHFSGKRLVPVTWSVAPEELPGWAKDYQALDLRGSSPDQVRAQVDVLASRIGADRQKGYLFVGLLLFLLVALGVTSNNG
jgi:hypothetical protein